MLNMDSLGSKISDYSLFIVIFLIGLVVGAVFLFLGQQSTNQVRVFIALATVQGSFLAILISVFLLSLQVTASEFSPLSLEEIGNHSKFNALIGLFVFSILTDIFYIQTYSDPILKWNTTLNIEAGIAVFLGTLSLLSLIPAKQWMAEIVDPETVLTNAVESVNLDDVPSNKSFDIDSPPERTPLLTINQILQSACERNDEFTIRRSIYSMHSAIIALIQEESSECMNIDEDTLFKQWEKCIEIGSKGEFRRIRLICATHRRIIITLIKSDSSEYTEDRLRNLRKVLQKVFDDEIYESELISHFNYIIEPAIKEKDYETVEQAVTQERILGETVISNTKDGDQLSGEKRDVLSQIVSNILYTSREVTKSGTSKRHSQIAKKCNEAVDSLLELVLKNTRPESSLNPASKNILKTTATGFAKTTSTAMDKDVVVARNAFLALIEISIVLNRDAIDFFEEDLMKENETEFNKLLDQSINNIQGRRYHYILESLERIN